MATDRDLELLDDYLSDKLEGADKADFEARLEADASLRNELAIQRELISGLKSARVAELKSMLNQAVIPPASGSSMIAKFAAWVIAAAVVGLGSYYLWQQSEEPAIADESAVVTEDASVQSEEQTDISSLEATPDELQSQEEGAADTEVEQANENAVDSDQKVQSVPDTRVETPQESSPVIQPDVTPYDPTKELEAGNGRPEPIDELGDDYASVSSITVEVVDTGKKNDFHYQFKEGKLYLLGSFEKDLYEIMEFFNDNKRTVFLYYNSGFYLLDESKVVPTPLSAITDTELLQKLRNYREK